MRPVLKAFLMFGGAALLLGAIGVALFMNTGFSAKPAPGSLETSGALTVRNLAIRMKARGLNNPVDRSPEAIASGREHFADHCASCHANDGSGNTPSGKACIRERLTCAWRARRISLTASCFTSSKTASG